jgi:hypothetical protein
LAIRESVRSVRAVKKYGVTETLCVHGPDLAARVMMAVTARGQNPNFRWRPRRFGLWANMNIPTSGVFQWSKGVIVGASSADATPWFHYSGITDKWTEETDPALPSGDVGSMRVPSFSASGRTESLDTGCGCGGCIANRGVGPSVFL